MNLIINVIFMIPWDFLTWILKCYKKFANNKIQQCHPYQQEDGSSYGPLVVAMARHIAYQLIPDESIYNMISSL